MDPGHIPTSEMELFVSKTIVAQVSIIEVDGAPGYNSNGWLLLYFSKTKWDEKIPLKSIKLFFNYKAVI